MGANLADGVDAADAAVAWVDATRSGALLRGAALKVPDDSDGQVDGNVRPPRLDGEIDLLRALGTASSDGVGLGEESWLATANTDAQRTDSAIGIGATRMRNARVTLSCGQSRSCQRNQDRNDILIRKLEEWDRAAITTRS